jgi:HEAT repeat protein
MKRTTPMTISSNHARALSIATKTPFGLASLISNAVGSTLRVVTRSSAAIFLASGMFLVEVQSPMAAPQAAASSASSPSAQDDKEELAIAALRALMAAPPERALPLLEKTLAGKQSERVKERALFVLAQIDLPAAEQLLFQYAQASTSPTLKKQAIRSLGIRGGANSAKSLAGLFAKADQQTREQIINALLIAGARAELMTLAKAHANEEIVDKIVSTLAVMGAREELRQLADSGLKSEGLAHAYAISGDVDALVALIAKSTKPEQQAELIRKIGITSGSKARQALVDFYRGSTSEDVREAALNGLMIQGDAEPLLALYRAAQSNKEKSRILKVLSIMDGDAALDAIDSALQGEAP